MREVAIIGAGPLGGMTAHLIARGNVAPAVRLIDDTGRIAEGIALDISQAAPVEQFSTTVTGSRDLSRAAGADLIIVADRAGGPEWQGEEGCALLRRIKAFAPEATVLCAGATQRDLVEYGCGRIGYPRTRLLGSSPEALGAAAKAIVALEAGISPREIALSVVGIPPDRIVIGWEDGAAAGAALTRVFSEPTRRRLSDKIARLWPPGPYALAAAAMSAARILAGRSRASATCFVAPDPAAGFRLRTAALPIRLDQAGTLQVSAPALSAGEQVAFDNAVLL